MFNFQPFSSNQPGATRAHLLDEDGQLAGVVSFTLNESFVRVSAEVFDHRHFHGVRHSVSMIWDDGRVRLDDVVPDPVKQPAPPTPAWAYWRRVA